MSERFGDHYHSLHGAEQESNHVFIENGLKFAQNRFNSLQILEVGMGTGLNVALTQKHKLNDRAIYYTTIEPYPLEQEILGSLKFSFSKTKTGQHDFDKIHRVSWNTWHEIKMGFHFYKSKLKLMEFEPKSKYNLIYYDAFGPAYQPEMWDIPMIRKLSDLADENSVLVTYCAQGAFRRNLEKCGFVVELLPGPPGKREMTRAVKLK